MRALELKVPPGALVLLFAALMWLAARALPDFEIEFPARGAIALGLGGAGLAMSALGVVSFRRARTTVNPMRPGSSSALVVSGIYAISRNPMYLGFLLALAGWAVFLANAVVFLFLPAFYFYMNRFQIAPEERALAALFGREFVDYKARVRRWI